MGCAQLHPDSGSRYSSHIERSSLWCVPDAGYRETFDGYHKGAAILVLDKQELGTMGAGNNRCDALTVSSISRGNFGPAGPGCACRWLAQKVGRYHQMQGRKDGISRIYSY